MKIYARSVFSAVKTHRSGVVALEEVTFSGRKKHQLDTIKLASAVRSSGLFGAKSNGPP